MNTAKFITVLVADDHAVVRQGICALLMADGHFAVVGQARTGREAVKLALALRPDVILMDVSMPELNGFEATRQIISANPAVKVIVLSARSDPEYIKHMRAVGATGFIEKLNSAGDLIKAIQEVARGNIFYSPAFAKYLRDEHGGPRDRDGLLTAKGRRLTAREAEVLQLVAEGSANKRIAAELGISIKTVEKHRQGLMDKLKIHDTAGLTRYAISNGVIGDSV